MLKNFYDQDSFIIFEADFYRKKQVTIDSVLIIQYESF